jgi:hypothetical protein
VISVDVNRLASAAVEAFLENENHSQNERPESEHHRFGGVGAVVVGVALAAGARAAYRRARRLDLERVAKSVEDRLKP